MFLEELMRNIYGGALLFFSRNSLMIYFDKMFKFYFLTFFLLLNHF